MRCTSLLAFLVFGVPCWAQQELPEQFFIECKNGEVLILVDRKELRFDMKKPAINDSSLVENDDSLRGGGSRGMTPAYFNKWTGFYGSHNDCEVLDADDRKPLFK